MVRRLFTAEEVAYIRAHFPDQNTKDIAKALNRSYSSIAYKAANLGLKKSQAFLSDNEKTGRSNLIKHGTSTRFTKKHQPWNKGKSFHAGGNSVKTQFKKGGLPHNTKEDGAITTRIDKRGVKQLFIRVELGKWIPLKIHNWLKAGNKIPKGHCVRFIDGNTMNCEVSNLECVSKKENMLKNSIMRYPKELRQSMHALSKLQKVIANAEK